MSERHSAAPWAHSPVFNGHGDLVHDHIVDGNGEVIAEVHDEKDVPVIVAAAELLGLLVQSHKVLRGMRINRGSAGGNCGQCGKLWNGEQEKHHDNCLLVKIDAAIAKAGGAV